MDQRKYLSAAAAIALSLTACTTVPDKPQWVSGEEVRGFFSVGCQQKEDGSYQDRYFSLLKNNVQMTFLYGKEKACEGRAGVIVVTKRKLPKTHWISANEFVWGMPKAGDGFMIVGPGDNARLMLQQAGGDMAFNPAEEAAIVETGIVPLPLAQDLCYWKGKLSDDGRGFFLMLGATEKACFATFDDAKMANNSWGPLHIWSEKAKQAADELYEEAEIQYKAALARNSPAS